MDGLPSKAWSQEGGSPSPWSWRLQSTNSDLDSWPCGILYIPVEIEICISYAFTKTHNLRRFVHVHAIQQ